LFSVIINSFSLFEMLLAYLATGRGWSCGELRNASMAAWEMRGRRSEVFARSLPLRISFRTEATQKPSFSAVSVKLNAIFCAINAWSLRPVKILCLV
jgi:hypothetical protein